MSKIADETLFKLIHDFLLIYLPTQRNSSPNTIRAYQQASPFGDKRQLVRGNAP